MGAGAILGLLVLAMTHFGKANRKDFSTLRAGWLALLLTLAIATRFVYGWWHATRSGNDSVPGNEHLLMTASGTPLSWQLLPG